MPKYFYFELQFPANLAFRGYPSIVTTKSSQIGCSSIPLSKAHPPLKQVIESFMQYIIQLLIIDW